MVNPESIFIQYGLKCKSPKKFYFLKVLYKIPVPYTCGQSSHTGGGLDIWERMERQTLTILGIYMRDYLGNITRRNIFISLSQVNIFGFCLAQVTSLPHGYDPVFMTSCTTFKRRAQMVTSCPTTRTRHEYIFLRSSTLFLLDNNDGEVEGVWRILPLEECSRCRLTSAHLKNTLTSARADIRSSALE